jgi:hypothetical protein
LHNDAFDKVIGEKNFPYSPNDYRICSAHRNRIRVRDGQIFSMQLPTAHPQRHLQSGRPTSLIFRPRRPPTATA